MSDIFRGSFTETKEGLIPVFDSGMLYWILIHPGQLYMLHVPTVM